MKLDLLGEAQAVVEELGKAVAASRPRLDVEFQQLSIRGTEFDLTSLEVPCQSHEPKRPRGGAGHPHRSVPWSGHPDHELVIHSQRAPVATEFLKGGELARGGAVRVGHHLVGQLLRRYARPFDANAVVPMKMWTGSLFQPLHLFTIDRIRERRRGIVWPGSFHLVAVQRRRAPQIPPRRQCQADRPARGGRQAAGEGGSAHGLSAYPRDGRVSRCDAEQSTSPHRGAWMAPPRRLARNRLALRDPLDPCKDRRSGGARQRGEACALCRALAADVLADRGFSRAARIARYSRRLDERFPADSGDS